MIQQSTAQLDMELHFDHKLTKVKQLADHLQKAITVNDLKAGEKLPSINFLSKKHEVSRDTVFKAFKLLKEIGLIDSNQGKSYFVTAATTDILILLDEYSQFKEALFTSFRNQLPLTYRVDLLFHQYNENLFNTIIKETAGHYSKYLVMNYNNETFSEALKHIDPQRLLLLDFGNFDKQGFSYICQNFDENFYDALVTIKDRLRKYEKLVFVFNKSHKHPKSSKAYFEKFCRDYDFNYLITDEFTENMNVEKGNLYIAIKQSDVVNIIKSFRRENFSPGAEAGIIAYNDNPIYEVVADGISSISIDFRLMGAMASQFVLSGESIQTYLPTNVIIRNSL